MVLNLRPPRRRRRLFGRSAEHVTDADADADADAEILDLTIWLVTLLGLGRMLRSSGTDETSLVDV
ncbi:MAG TPA: hypothetical protein VMV22_09555 [Acidimicrobiales bacterium]|nr:hypothetical protein [Acidimicrobiales bacterium]